MSKGTFEARVIRENKSAKGIYLTIEVGADDYYAARLHELRPNALLMIAYDETLDVSIQPIGQSAGTLMPVQMAHPSGDDATPSSSSTAAPQGGSTVTAAISPKERTPFAAKPLSQQAGLRCSDFAFKQFLQTRFQEIFRNAYGDPAETVRQLCKVKSRAALDINPDAAALWHALNNSFQTWLTTQQHADTYR